MLIWFLERRNLMFKSRFLPDNPKVQEKLSLLRLKPKSEGLKMKPWLLPKGLQRSEWARKVLGVQAPKMDLSPFEYLEYYDEKVLKLLEKCQEQDVKAEWVLDDLLVEKWPWGPRAPEECLEKLKAEVASWQAPRRNLAYCYLEKKCPLKDVLDHLGMKPEDLEENPPSEEEFLRELQELDLREFLELV